MVGGWVGGWVGGGADPWRRKKNLVDPPTPILGNVPGTFRLGEGKLDRNAESVGYGPGIGGQAGRLNPQEQARPIAGRGCV